jgi:hypothetical protein
VPGLPASPQILGFETHHLNPSYHISLLHLLTAQFFLKKKMFHNSLKDYSILWSKSISGAWHFCLIERNKQ